MTSIQELIPVLQTAIGPVILISGVGLLLLSMTNRFSRVIDRARSLLSISETQAGPPRQKTLAQIDILWSQANLIRLSILFASISLLCAALRISSLFITALFGIEDAWLLSIIFVACMGSLITSLVVFITDINRSLSAFKVELYGYAPKQEE
ncbi:MAG: DUF2721 domain-containing protein [Chloroflexota bacterium]